MRASVALEMVRSLYRMMWIVLATHMVAMLGRGSSAELSKNRYPLQDEKTIQSNGNDKPADGVDESQSTGPTMASGPVMRGDQMTIAMSSASNAVAHRSLTQAEVCGSVLTHGIDMDSHGDMVRAPLSGEAGQQAVSFAYNTGADNSAPFFGVRDGWKSSSAVAVPKRNGIIKERQVGNGPTGFLMMMAGSSRVAGPKREDVVAALSQTGIDKNDLFVCLLRKLEICMEDHDWTWRSALDVFTIEAIDAHVSDEKAWERDYAYRHERTARACGDDGRDDDDDEDEYYDAEDTDEECSDGESPYDDEDYNEGGIVYYDASRGFGFIRDADGERVYFHVSQFGEIGYMRAALDNNWDSIRDREDGYAPVYFRYVWNEERDEWNADNVRWNDGSE